jgi:hypothetical protein
LGVMPVMDLAVGVHTVQLVVSDGLESAQATAQIVVKSVSVAVRTAASPSTIGRTSEIADVKFYVLLPAGKSVYDVDTQAPIDLEINGARTLLVRDPTYNHKKYTVVAYTARKTVLDLAGPTNGLKSAKVVVRLRTGETVSGTINLQVVAGLGTSSVLVLAERTSYYFDTQTWK